MSLEILKKFRIQIHEFNFRFYLWKKESVEKRVPEYYYYYGDAAGHGLSMAESLRLHMFVVKTPLRLLQFQCESLTVRD